jgi:hypothetical protein
MAKGRHGMKARQKMRQSAQETSDHENVDDWDQAVGKRDHEKRAGKGKNAGRDADEVRETKPLCASRVPRSPEVTVTKGIDTASS